METGLFSFGWLSSSKKIQNLQACQEKTLSHYSIIYSSWQRNASQRDRIRHKMCAKLLMDLSLYSSKKSWLLLFANIISNPSELYHVYSQLKLSPFCEFRFLLKKSALILLTRNLKLKLQMFKYYTRLLLKHHLKFSNRKISIWLSRNFIDPQRL
jgi:hypothetical protein